MTDNAELIAVAMTWCPAEVAASPVGAANLIGHLAAALEAAEKRAELAERQVEIRANDSIAARIARQNVRAVEEWARVNQERDQLAAVIEKVEDFVTRHYLDTQMGRAVLTELSTPLGDALREVKAAVWGEALTTLRAHGWLEDGDDLNNLNPYREEQDRG